MTMDHPEEQKNIHVNPDFLSGKNKGQSNAKVHVNPAFLQKSRPVQPNTFASISSQRQGTYPGYSHLHSGASNISHTNTPLQPRIVENPTRTYFPQNKPPLGTNLYKYERNRTQPPQQTVLFTDPLAGTTRNFKTTTGKPPRVPTTVSVNRRHNTNIRPVQQYPNLSSRKPVIAKGSPYSWTASRGPSIDATKSSHTTINKAQSDASQTNTNLFIRNTNDRSLPEIHNLSPKGDSKVPIQAEVSASKGPNILVNPKLLQSIAAATSNPLLSLQSRPQTQLSVESAASHADATKTLSKKETPKKTSKFKVLSRTKLVRRHSSSGSTEGSLLSLIKKSYPKSCAVAIHQCSPKFPVRARKYSTSSGLKKRYLIKSRTKLVRQLSGSSTSSKDGSAGNTKYSLKTKTKLVRRRSNSSTPQEMLKKAEGVVSQVCKSFGNKSAVEKGAKFSILSKTKLVRRRSSQSLNRSNMLIRNNSGKTVKCWSTRACGLPQVRKINNIYKVQNDFVRMSLKQKAAKGIISKYKINRLKVESVQGSRPTNDKSLRPYLRQKGVKGLISKYKINHLRADLSKTHFRGVAERKQRYSTFKRRKLNVHSDHIINIGGILYKSTKMSLRKQLAKTKKPESDNNKTDAACIVHLRGDKFQVSAGGRTLKRVTDAPGAVGTRPSLSRVHIGGLTYSQTANGQYELTKVHQARAVLSSAKQRSVLTLSQRRKRGSLQKRNEYCIFFNRFGRCSKKEQGDCPYIHDPKRIAICTRFLRGRCPVKKCPFSHVIDPDKMPVCSHFVKVTCTRDNCPYRHVRVNPSAPICLEFLRGHCTLGEECKKQHVLRCEEFSTTGTCPRGATCPLSHHRSRSKRKKSVSLEPAQVQPKKTMFIRKKRKVSESLDVLGGPSVKGKAEKKARGKVVPKKRYFHVDNVEGNDADEKFLHAPSDPISNSQLASSVPESLTKPVGSITEKHTEQDRAEEQIAETSLVSSRIEETRKRILGKIEKMKQTASNLELNDAGVLVDKTCEKREGLPFGPSPKTVSENEKLEDDSRGILSQRPPLPKRLPSYIPLSMDDEN